MTEVEQIIEGLNTVQSSGIRRAAPLYLDCWLLPLGSGRGLTAMGVAQRTIDGMCLTPLGLQVKAALEARSLRARAMEEAAPCP
jgi:hypothetical protein